ILFILLLPPRSTLFPYTTLFRSLTHVFFCVSKNVSVSCAYTQGKREQFSGFNRTLDAINNVFRKFSAFHDETGRLNVRVYLACKIGRAVQQECRDRDRMPSPS